MSASVTSDRAVVRRRGAMLTYIFSNQGWGSFAGSLATMAVLGCYKTIMQEGKTSRVDGAWRIIVGISLVPAFGTLYQRLTLPESRRFEAARKLDEEDDELQKEKKAQLREDARRAEIEKGNITVEDSGNGAETPTSSIDKKSAKEKSGISAEQVIEDEMGIGSKEAARRKKSHLKEFLAYFSEWRHAKILLGTSLCWFFLDIALVFLLSASRPKILIFYLVSTVLT